MVHVNLHHDNSFFFLVFSALKKKRAKVGIMKNNGHHISAMQIFFFQYFMNCSDFSLMKKFKNSVKVLRHPGHLSSKKVKSGATGKRVQLSHT